MGSLYPPRAGAAPQAGCACYDAATSFRGCLARRTTRWSEPSCCILRRSSISKHKRHFLCYRAMQGPEIARPRICRLRISGGGRPSFTAQTCRSAGNSGTFLVRCKQAIRWSHALLSDHQSVFILFSLTSTPVLSRTSPVKLYAAVLK